MDLETSKSVFLNVGYILKLLEELKKHKPMFVSQLQRFRFLGQPWALGFLKTPQMILIPDEG